MEDLFRFLVVFALQSAGDLRGRRQRPRRHLRDLGRLQLRPRRHRHAGRVQLLGAVGRTGAGRGGSRWSVVLFVVAPLIGFLLDRVIMRRLADASTITTIVATIGLLFVVRVAGRDPLAAGDLTCGAPRVLPRQHVLGPRASTSATTRSIVLGTACSSRSGCGSCSTTPAWGRDAGGGRQPRARRAQRRRPRPGVERGLDARLLLAALAGILIAPILPQFTPVALTLLVIQAYAAAMVGRLRSLPLTFLGAVILAELESVLAFIDTKRLGGDTVADLAKDLQAVGAGDPAVRGADLPAPGPGARRARPAATSPRSRRTRTMVLSMATYVAVAFVIVAVGLGLGRRPSTSSGRASPSAS